MPEQTTLRRDQFVAMGVGKQPSGKLAEKFSSEKELVEYLTEGNDLTDISGVGSKSSALVQKWFENEYPDKERERIEEDEAYCTQYTTDHGLSDEQLADIDGPVWAWICPRCDHKNPMKGDPDDFGDRPFACVDCRWVPLLERSSLMEFAERERIA